MLEVGRPRFINFQSVSLENKTYSQFSLPEEHLGGRH